MFLKRSVISRIHIAEHLYCVIGVCPSVEELSVCGVQPAALHAGAVLRAGLLHAVPGPDVADSGGL